MRTNGRGGGLVRDHHDRLAELVDGPAQQVEDLGRGRGVEVAGRLVGEDHRGLGGQRARHRHPLLLPARQLGRAVGAPVGQRDGLEQALDAAAGVITAGERERKADVLLGGEDRHEVEGLEHEADLVAAQPRQVPVVEPADLRPGDLDAALRRPVEAGEHVHQRGLAGARGAHDRGEGGGRDVQRDAAERVDGRVALAVALGEVASRDD